MHKHTLLLTLDFINDIIHPDGKLAGSAAYANEHFVIDKLNDTIHWARTHQLPIVHVLVGFDETYTQRPAYSPLFDHVQSIGALQLGTWGTEFHEAVDVQGDDLVLVKHQVGAVHQTSLLATLDQHNITTVMIAGVSTNMAVESTVRELHDRGYDVVVVEDACACADSDTQQQSINDMQRLARIIKSSELS